VAGGIPVHRREIERREVVTLQNANEVRNALGEIEDFIERHFTVELQTLEDSLTFHNKKNRQLRDELQALLESSERLIAKIRVEDATVARPYITDADSLAKFEDVIERIKKEHA
jgi:hypothetical protein